MLLNGLGPRNLGRSPVASAWSPNSLALARGSLLPRLAAHDAAVIGTARRDISMRGPSHPQHFFPIQSHPFSTKITSLNCHLRFIKLNTTRAMGSVAKEQPLSLQFAERLTQYGLHTASEDDIKLATHAFVDTIACILVGRPEEVVDVVSKLFGRAPGKSLLIGSKDAQRTSILDATLINGVAGHALDYDDMVNGGHPSTPIIPALLALGEELGSSGADLVDAYLAGFETHQRFSNVLLPHHYNAGWHPTATIGTFGATAACSRLLKLDPYQTATAISLAASMSSGLKANFGTMGKPLHIGNCGRSGLEAALLVKEGFTANPLALEHKQGFFNAFDGMENLDMNKFIKDWPRQLAISRGPYGLKPYPCCGSTHPGILATFDLRRKNPDLDISQVKGIEITVFKDRIPHTNNPDPKSPLQAKFSTQYTTCRALLSGSVGLKHFEEGSYDEEAIKKLLKLVTVKERPESSSRDISETYAGTVKVTLEDGSELVGDVSGVLGPGSEQPLSKDELYQKFEDCASHTLTDEAIPELFDLLWKIPELDNLKDILTTMEKVKA